MASIHTAVKVISDFFSSSSPLKVQMPVPEFDSLTFEGDIALAHHPDLGALAAHQKSRPAIAKKERQFNPYD